MVSYFSCTTTLIQTSVDDSVRGRVIGEYGVVFGGAMPIGSLVAGILAQYLGLYETLIISPLICLIFTTTLSILSYFDQKDLSFGHTPVVSGVTQENPDQT